MKNTIHKGKFTLGKVDYNRSGRKNCLAEFEFELRDGENGPEFSATAGIWNPRKTGYHTCGQCLEEVAKEAAPLPPKAARCLEIWRLYHLNGMNAGLPEQEAAVKEWTKAGNHYDYTKVCNMLKERGLYELPVPEGATATGGFPEEVKSGSRGYRYGERWVYSGLPADIIEEIKSW